MSKQIGINRAMGTKWFTFYVKVRPWLVAIFSFLISVVDFVQHIDTYVNRLGFLCVFVASITEVVLCIIVAVKADEDYKEFVRFVNGVLLFETCYMALQMGVQQYYTSGLNIGESMVVAGIVGLVAYFLWYRLNIKYFRKRLLQQPEVSTAQNNDESTPSVEGPASTTSTQAVRISLSAENEKTHVHGNYNIYGSDIMLQKGSEVPKTLPVALPVTRVGETPPSVVISPVRYCSRCGQSINPITKQCRGCGKQYFKFKFKPLYVVLLIVILFGGYIGINYSYAISAMNNQEFINSQQYFDNLIISETLFPQKYAYVEAGVLMEEGKYREALAAFDEISNVPVPATITDSLKSKIYTAGQAAYTEGNMTEAKSNFEIVDGYKRSADYLFLIGCNENYNLNNYWDRKNAELDYNKLIRLLGFENVDEIILKNHNIALLFLAGRWEDGSAYPYYFEIKESEGWISSYNIPCKDIDGTFSIDKGVYSLDGGTFSTKCFKFSIVNEDTITIYCYKDGSVHKLYRQ